MTSVGHMATAKQKTIATSKEKIRYFNHASGGPTHYIIHFKEARYSYHSFASFYYREYF